MKSDSDLPRQEPVREVRRHIGSAGAHRPFRRELQQRGKEDLEETADTKKKERKKREKVMQPNILGGGLAIVSIIVVFLLIRAYPHSSPRVASARTDNKKIDNTVVLEARQRVQSDVQKQIDGVVQQAENLNVKDAAAPRVNKILDDFEATKGLPKQFTDVKDQGAKVVGKAMTSIGRLQKIIQDASGIKDVILDKIKGL